jgi:hypothetical protein
MTCQEESRGVIADVPVSYTGPRPPRSAAIPAVGSRSTLARSTGDSPPGSVPEEPIYMCGVDSGRRPLVAVVQTVDPGSRLLWRRPICHVPVVELQAGERRSIASEVEVDR